LIETRGTSEHVSPVHGGAVTDKGTHWQDARGAVPLPPGSELPEETIRRLRDGAGTDLVATKHLRAEGGPMTDTLTEKRSDYGGLGYYSYDELVTSQGAEIVLAESDHDYQGDTYYLLRQGNRYGYLVVGWGSCSGCDALEGCSTFEDVRQLRDMLVQGIWWGTAAAVADHITARTQANDWYITEETFRVFRDKALTMLHGEAP
jgi:hypothetical protein